VIPYLKGHELISLMNEVFGFDGWSYSVTTRTIDSCEYDPESRFWSVGVTVVCKVTLCRQYGGSFREGVGCGEEAKGRTQAAAVSKASKQAETDALKRACRLFGNATGNCLWNADFLRWVQALPRPGCTLYSETDLYRRGQQQDSRIAVGATIVPMTPPSMTGNGYSTQDLEEIIAADGDDDF
jgi:DNA repair and recombination protein RAD52